MTDAEITVETMTNQIVTGFLHLYPTLGAADILVRFNDDETIDVMIPDVTTFRTELVSDDDGYLRFGLYDPDFIAENPDHDLLDPVMVRIKAY